MLCGRFHLLFGMQSCWNFLGGGDSSLPRPPLGGGTTSQTYSCLVLSHQNQCFSGFGARFSESQIDWEKPSFTWRKQNKTINRYDDGPQCSSHPPLWPAPVVVGKMLKWPSPAKTQSATARGSSSWAPPGLGCLCCHWQPCKMGPRP